MPRLPLGYVVTEEGVVPPDKTETLETILIEVPAEELELVPPPDEVPETIRLLMENWEYTQHEAEIFSEVLRESIDKGWSHSDAVLAAESAVADHRAEIVRQEHLVNYRRDEPLVTMTVEEPETIVARDEAEDKALGLAISAPVMERVRRRRGDEKLIHVSTAVPLEVKKQMEAQAEARGMKLGAHVRDMLERALDLYTS